MIKEADVCIVGAGPAGMVLALLLAKVGVKVIVMEQHKDFEREYRGEVLMPRFVQMMKQLHLYEELEKCHHLKLRKLEGFYKNHPFFQIGFEKLSPEIPFALWMPQPVLLNFLHQKAKKFESYEILFDVGVKSLIEEAGKVQGVKAHNERGEPIEIRAKITVGADGRFSILRRQGKFELEEEDYHFDLLWFSIPRPESTSNEVRFFLSEGYNYLILPKYPDLLQCGFVLPCGEFSKFRQQGIESIRKILLCSDPLFHEFAEKLTDFHSFSLLQARIERVKKWARDGALLVGDSAHTCSPAGAIGVSVAVASAMVAADVISQSIALKDYSVSQLSKLQEIRQEEVREIQEIQKNFTNLLAPQSKMIRFLLPLFFPLVARMGILENIQRRLLVMDKPLPISSQLIF